MSKILSVSVLALMVAAPPALAQTFSIGTNPQGSTAYSTGAAVARVAKDKLDARARVVPQGGPVVTLPLVNSGRLDASIANSMVATLAYEGRAMFKGKAQKDIRVVAVVRTLRLGVFVAKDSNIQTLADLKGVRLSSKFPKQRNQEVLLKAFLAMANLTYDDVDGVPAPSGVRGVDDFLAGKVDAAMFSMDSGKVQQAHASKPIRFLSIPDDPQSVERMQTVAPGTVVDTVEPSPRYPGVEQPTKIMALPFLVMAAKGTSEETVYELTKAMAQSKKLMVSVFKGMSDFDPEGMYLDFGVPYHPGAMKYYRETGQAK